MLELWQPPCDHEGKAKRIVEKTAKGPTPMKLLNFPILQQFVLDEIRLFLLVKLFSLVFKSHAGQLRCSMRSVVELPEVTPWPGTVEGLGCERGLPSKTQLNLWDPSSLPIRSFCLPSRRCKSKALTFLDKAAVKRVLL